MSDPPLLFAVLTGVAAAGNAISVRLGASRITPAAGAVVVGAVALTVNLAVLGTLKLRGEPLVVTPRGLAWVLAAGVAAAGVDLFSLMAYARGLRVTSSPLMTATYLAIVLLVGVIVLREPLGLLRLLAIALIAAGIWLLQATGV
jgi:drug/metabolite transporter (DMT)-like permease